MGFKGGLWKVNCGVKLLNRTIRNQVAVIRKVEKEGGPTGMEPPGPDGCCDRLLLGHSWAHSLGQDGVSEPCKGNLWELLLA